MSIRSIKSYNQEIRRKHTVMLSHLTIPSNFSYEFEQVKIISPKPKEKRIINRISGGVSSGKILGILGSKKSGKTTLLKYLAGYLTDDFETEGSLMIGGVEGLSKEERRSLCGYVLKEDILNQELTVKEHVEYSANLKLPKNFNKDEIKFRVKETIEVLELENDIKIKIGGDEHRSPLPNYKRKMAQIGAELVRDCAIMIIDEPTKGLHCLEKEKVIAFLRKIAESGKIIIIAMEQCSVDILNLLDLTMILHQGRQLYYGKFTEMREYFKSKDIKIPKFSNPVDYILNLVNMSSSSLNRLSEGTNKGKVKKYYKKQTRNKILQNRLSLQELPTQTIINMNRNELLVRKLLKNGKMSKKSFKTGYSILYKKYKRIFWRNRKGFRLRLWLGITQSLVACILYWNVGYDFASIQNRKGLLFFVMMYTTLASLQIAAFSLGSDRSLLQKELREGYYVPSSYFFAKTLAPLLPSLFIVLCVSNFIFLISNMNSVDFMHYLIYNMLIIMGVLASESIGILVAVIAGTSENTNNLVPILITPLSLFSGFIIDLDSIPGILLPLKSNFFKFMYEGLVVNEFDNLNGCKKGICDIPYKEMDFQLGTKECLYILIGIAIVTRFIAWVVFIYKYRKFME